MTAARMPQAPPAVTVASEKLAEYAGRYQFAPGVVSEVKLDGDTLVERTTGQPGDKLIPVGPDVFYAPSDVEARVEFTRDAQGRVTAQVYRSGSQTMTAPKIQEVQP